MIIVQNVLRDVNTSFSITVIHFRVCFFCKAFKACSSVEYNGWFTYYSTDLKLLKYIFLSTCICDFHI